MARALYYTFEAYKKSMLIGFRDMQENIFPVPLNVFLHLSNIWRHYEWCHTNKLKTITQLLITAFYVSSILFDWLMMMHCVWCKDFILWHKQSETSLFIESVYLESTVFRVLWSKSTMLVLVNPIVSFCNGCWSFKALFRISRGKRKQ